MVGASTHLPPPASVLSLTKDHRKRPKYNKLLVSTSPSTRVGRPRPEDGPRGRPFILSPSARRSTASSGAMRRWRWMWRPGSRTSWRRPSPRGLAARSASPIRPSSGSRVPRPAPPGQGLSHGPPFPTRLPTGTCTALRAKDGSQGAPTAPGTLPTNCGHAAPPAGRVGHCEHRLRPPADSIFIQS